MSLNPGTALPCVVLYRELPEAVAMVQPQHLSGVGWGDWGNVLPAGEGWSHVSLHPFSSWPRLLYPKTWEFRANNRAAQVKAAFPFLFYSPFNFLTALKTNKKKLKSPQINFSVLSLSLTSYIDLEEKGVPFKMVNEK